MPLIQGYSDEARQQNIEKLIGEGYNPEQAVAIAYDVQRKNKKLLSSRTLQYVGMEKIAPRKVDKI